MRCTLALQSRGHLPLIFLNLLVTSPRRWPPSPPGPAHRPERRRRPTARPQCSPQTGRQTKRLAALGPPVCPGSKQKYLPRSGGRPRRPLLRKLARPPRPSPGPKSCQVIPSIPLQPQTGAPPPKAAAKRTRQTIITGAANLVNSEPPLPAHQSEGQLPLAPQTLLKASPRRWPPSPSGPAHRPERRRRPTARPRCSPQTGRQTKRHAALSPPGRPPLALTLSFSKVESKNRKTTSEQPGGQERQTK